MVTHNFVDNALAELRRIATSDRPFVEAALFDRWVPQLSSKTVGITDKHTGVTYGDAGDIRQVADHGVDPAVGGGREHTPEGSHP